MPTDDAHCPSCAETLCLPILQQKATATLTCPGCQAALQVQLEPFPAWPVLRLIAAPAASDDHRHDADRASSTLGVTPCGDTRASRRVCTHCQQPVAEYRFLTGDGFSIVTYHCAEHGDIIPSHRSLEYHALVMCYS